MFCKSANQNKNNFRFANLTKSHEWSNKLSYCFGKIEKNMDLSRIHLAVMVSVGLLRFYFGGSKSVSFGQNWTCCKKMLGPQNVPKLDFQRHFLCKNFRKNLTPFVGPYLTWEVNSVSSWNLEAKKEAVSRFLLVTYQEGRCKFWEITCNFSPIVSKYFL